MELSDDNEARQVKQLCAQVSQDLKEITQEGKYLVGKKSQAGQLGLLVTVHRYADRVLNP